MARTTVANSSMAAYSGSPQFRVGRSEAGTSLLEMALLLPILLILLLGIIEIGRYAELSIQVASAARAGAQYGAQNLATAASSGAIQTAAVNDSQIPACSPITTAPTNPGCLAVLYAAYPYQGLGYVMCGCSSDGSGNQPAAPGATCPASCSSPAHPLVYVQVNTQAKFNSLFNYPGIPSPITINGSAQLRVGQD